MLTTSRTTPAQQTFRTIRDREYRIRKVETYTFTVYLSGGRWVEPTTPRAETNYTRLKLPCVKVQTTHETLSRKGERSTYVIRSVRGEYSDCVAYLDSVANIDTVSYRDGFGLLAEYHLTDSDSPYLSKLQFDAVGV